nr:peptidylprolyl isomerase [uncultured Stomatobaculum sp.]
MEPKLHLKPYLKLYLKGGAKIVIELWPEAAPNAVNSLIYVASHGWMDHHAIQRIAPGKWVDLSYNAYGHEECRYLIPDEFKLNPNLEPLTPRPGVICMGGYDEAGLASAEIFFPLKEFPEFRGIYPVLGEVIEGMDEIRRIAELPTREGIYPGTDKKILEPADPQIIERAELQRFG